MYYAITILMIILAVLLVLVVLIQRSKGGGLSSQFNSNAFMGVQKTADFVEKATWFLAIGILVLALSTNFVTKSASATDDKVKIQEQIDNAPEPPKPQQQPQAPGTQPQ